MDFREESSVVPKGYRRKFITFNKTLYPDFKQIIINIKQDLFPII